MILARNLLAQIRTARGGPRLPEAARAAAVTDRVGPAPVAAQPTRIIDECIAWLGRAQDCSTSRDGGVARHYSLISGWGPSYPETTGYIIPTLLAYAERMGCPEGTERARRMLDWLVAIQLPDGGFQGGIIGAVPVVPVVFNTGQILMGLAAGERAFGGYREPLQRAADWLVSVQDRDGCWRKYPSPFARPGEKTYDAHVAWGLIEAARCIPDRGYGEAALSNLLWVLGRQQSNGWLADCCLSDPTQPLTHTLGYALRGLLEGHLYSSDFSLLEAALRAADGILTALDAGKLPGRLNARWQATVDWVCLTGSGQIAHCWLQLYQLTGERRYLNAGRQTNAWVRRTIALEGSPEVRGGVKGCFPVDGGYGAFEFLNWAAKFTVDANMLEEQLNQHSIPNT